MNIPTEGPSFVRIEYSGSVLNVPLDQYEAIIEAMTTEFAGDFITGHDMDGSEFILNKHAIVCVFKCTPATRISSLRNRDAIRRELHLHAMMTAEDIDI